MMLDFTNTILVADSPFVRSKTRFSTNPDEQMLKLFVDTYLKTVLEFPCLNVTPIVLIKQLRYQRTFFIQEAEIHLISLVCS